MNRITNFILWMNVGVLVGFGVMFLAAIPFASATVTWTVANAISFVILVAWEMTANWIARR